MLKPGETQYTVSDADKRPDFNTGPRGPDYTI